MTKKICDKCKKYENVNIQSYILPCYGYSYLYNGADLLKKIYSGNIYPQEIDLCDECAKQYIFKEQQ